MTYRVAPSWTGPILCALVLTAAAFLALWLSRTPAAELPFAGGGREVSAESAYGELPLAFEPNAGRAAGGADFVSRSGSGAVFLDSDGATLVLGEGKRAEAIGLELAGASADEPRALERLPGVVNDLRGDDPERWRTGIPIFERVRYPGAWPGIDLDYYGDQRRLEYDFRLAPSADPNQIAIRVAGADDLRLAANGDLLIGARTETIRQRAPVAYQPATSDAPRTLVRASFALFGDTVGFRLGSYDYHRPLVIDPVVLAYSTYLGGSGTDAARAIAVDGTGAAYVTGSTSSTDFDTIGEIEGDSGGQDAFVSKLTPAGDALEYSTYLGGSGTDTASAIAVDSSGAAYVTGGTSSSDFNTVGKIEGDQPGGDVFASKLTPDGDALDYSTYLGGSGSDGGTGIAVDSTGAAYVTGQTGSTDFNTVGEIEGDSDFQDAFVSKLSATGDALVYSTYLGGDAFDDGDGIAVDSSGAAYVTGRTDSSDFNTVGEIEGDSASSDAFVSKLTPAGDALEYSTYLGGSGGDDASGIAVDGSGAAYVTGLTSSTDFDTVGEIEGDADGTNFDAFVSKLTPNGSALDYSTYLGGSGLDIGFRIDVDGSGAAYVTGGTDSSDFDTVGEIEGNSASDDAFVSKLTAAGNALTYSTYLGGNEQEGGLGIAVDSSGNAYITGHTYSTNLNTVGPIEGDSANSDAFVSKLTFTQECTITGTPGNDTLPGTQGADIVCGLGGNDTINGKRGDDELRGGEGKDVLIGARGDDTLDGGPDQDRAGYSTDAAGGINLSLDTGVVTSANLGTDTILQEAGTSTIEQAGGTEFADTLVGDGRTNLLEGVAGDDTIIGRGGADALVGAAGGDDLQGGGGGGDKLDPGPGDDPMVSGGAGSDTIRYSSVRGGGVAVDLRAGVASPLGGSDAGNDTLAADIESVIGSSGDDVLRAQLTGIVSVLESGEGADSLNTTDGDALDNARGGAGADTCTTDPGDGRSSCP
jgi:hypothetical protein